MTMPGFDAEASLYKSRANYRSLSRYQGALPPHRLRNVEVAVYAGQGRNRIIPALQPPTKGDPGLAYELCMNKCAAQGTSYYQCRLKCAGPDPVPGTNSSGSFLESFIPILAGIIGYLLGGGAYEDYCQKHPEECH
jgi:hypothetical protein